MCTLKLAAAKAPIPCLFDCGREGDKSLSCGRLTGVRIIFEYSFDIEPEITHAASHMHRGCNLRTMSLVHARCAGLANLTNSGRSGLVIFPGRFWKLLLS